MPMNRQQWKIYYRLQRIVRREERKARADMLMYGTGFIQIVNGEPKHIPAPDVILYQMNNQD